MSTQSPLEAARVNRLVAEANARADRAEARLRALLDPDRSGLMVTYGDDEPCIWRGDDAILRRDVAPEAFDVLAGLLGGGQR